MDRSEIEDMLLFFAQETSEVAFERYTNGELSQEELGQVYAILKNWTEETEKLLRMKP